MSWVDLSLGRINITSHVSAYFLPSESITRVGGQDFCASFFGVPPRHLLYYCLGILANILLDVFSPHFCVYIPPLILPVGLNCNMLLNMGGVENITVIYLPAVFMG